MVPVGDLAALHGLLRIDAGQRRGLLRLRIGTAVERGALLVHDVALRLTDLVRVVVKVANNFV